MGQGKESSDQPKIIQYVVDIILVPPGGTKGTPISTKYDGGKRTIDVHLTFPYIDEALQEFGKVAVELDKRGFSFATASNGNLSGKIMLSAEYAEVFPPKKVVSKQWLPPIQVLTDALGISPCIKILLNSGVVEEFSQAVTANAATGISVDEYPYLSIADPAVFNSLPSCSVDRILKNSKEFVQLPKQKVQLVKQMFALLQAGKVSVTAKKLVKIPMYQDEFKANPTTSLVNVFVNKMKTSSICKKEHAGNLCPPATITLNSALNAIAIYYIEENHTNDNA